MIETFKHKVLKRLYEKGERQGVGAAVVARVEDILSMLDAAETVEELNIPGYRLHELKGNRRGIWSMTVSGNWRIVFRFVDGAALDVDFTDYH